VKYSLKHGYILDLVPDEAIRNICSKMDTSTLSKFVRTTTRNFDLCNAELQRRKSTGVMLDSETRTDIEDCVSESYSLTLWDLLPTREDKMGHELLNLFTNAFNEYEDEINLIEESGEITDDILREEIAEKHFHQIMGEMSDSLLIEFFGLIKEILTEEEEILPNCFDEF